MKLHHRIAKALGLVTCSLALALGSAHALAGDKITLNDGSVLEGEIVREISGGVFLKTTVGGIESTRFIGPDDIASIDRGVETTGENITTPGSSIIQSNDDDIDDGTIRAAVLSMEGMVGLQMSHFPILDAIPYLEKEGVDVVVLRINSGGGFTMEVERLHQTIIDELKPRFRVVSWIESAISAAAMTSHVVEEIYFMPEGNYGGATQFSGAGNASKGRSLEDVLFRMEKASAAGGYDIDIARAMQISTWLSANIDENGNVEWFDSDQGEYILNEYGRIFTFNSQNAERFKFSKGTASTIDELAELMGYQEIKWVGDWEPGIAYPVSKAEQMQRDWREEISTAEQRFTEFFVKYQISLGNASQQQDADARGRFLGRAKRELAQLERIYKQHRMFSPGGQLTPAYEGSVMEELAETWFAEQHDLLRRLRAPR
ncbi:MAG: hypothetical protein AAF747_04235 [Planctomycetota bacterium]